MDKKIPLRQCVGCRQSYDKRDMVRVLKTPEGEITIDLKGKLNGRGAYVCKKKACLEAALKNKGIERSLSVKIPEDIALKLREELDQ